MKLRFRGGILLFRNAANLLSRDSTVQGVCGSSRQAEPFLIRDHIAHAQGMHSKYANLGGKQLALLGVTGIRSLDSMGPSNHDV